MIFRLDGYHWVDQARGWLILHLGEDLFLYPNGDIIHLPTPHQLHLTRIL